MCNDNPIQSNPVQSKTRFRAASIFGLRFFFLSLSQCNWYTKQMNRCCWAEWVTEREREYITIAIVWCVKSLTLWCRSITNPCCFLLLFVFPLNRLINNSIIITNAERQVQSDLLLVVGFFSPLVLFVLSFFVVAHFDSISSVVVDIMWSSNGPIFFCYCLCLRHVSFVSSYETGRGGGGGRVTEKERQRDKTRDQTVMQFM